MFRLQDTALAAVFAPELLIAIGVMTILDYILALAMSTTVDYRFCYHTPKLSSFTYFEPLPNILRHFHSTLVKMGLPKMAFHNLRHSCASFHLALGTNPKVVQNLLGHASIVITLQTYSHLLPGVSEEAAKKY